MPSRFLVLTASALVALAVAVPAAAQGKGGGKKPPKNTAGRPPGTGALSTSTSAGPSPEPGAEVQSPVAAAPFAWMDDASLMEPGSVWFGVSMVRWHGSGVSETIVPVVDGAIGLAPRVQLGVSVPRIAGGLGTTFFSAKVGVHRDEERSLEVAVAPTLEILGSGVVDSVPNRERRAQWGLPVSLHVDRENTRYFASSGYFSPGIWYGGAGLGRSISERVGVSTSFSRAWSSSEAAATAIGPRTEVSGGVSFDLKPNIAVFGSVGRTLGVAAEEGAGTTVAFGLSLSADPVLTR